MAGAGDIQVVAEIDDKRFLDGLDRMKAQVAAYQASNIRAEADALYRRTALQDQWRGQAIKSQDDVGRAVGMSSGQWVRLGAVGIAAVTGAIYAGRKAMEAYAKETGIGADGVKAIGAAMRESTLAAGRFALAADLQPKIESAYKFRAAVIDIGREMLQTAASFGDVGGAMEFTAAAKQREAVEKEARALDAARRTGADQAGRRAGIRGDTVEQARLQARAEYEARVKAINEMEGLSGSQKAGLIKGEREIRDAAVRKAIEDQQAIRDRERAEMQKTRREAAEAEAEKQAARDKESRQQAEQVQKNKEALELEARRLEIETLKAAGKDKEAEAAKIQLDYEQRMKDLAESGLSALERGQFAERFTAARDAELAGIGREKDKKNRRGGGGNVVIEGGNASILAQAFGGSGAGPAQNKEQVAEIKRTNEILKSIDRKVGEPSVAVLG